MAMDQKRKKTRRARERAVKSAAFYIALAVCLAAIGIAAWSTYDTVSGFRAGERQCGEHVVRGGREKRRPQKPRRRQMTRRTRFPAATRRGTAPEVQVEAEPEEP